MGCGHEKNGACDALGYALDDSSLVALGYFGVKTVELGDVDLRVY